MARPTDETAIRRPRWRWATRKAPAERILAFVRISTYFRALERPLGVEAARAIVETWLDRPNVWIPVPTDRHRSIFSPLLGAGRASGDHVPDAHLAALAIEWGIELPSADRDFARYPGLRWRDPLASGRTGRATLLGTQPGWHGGVPRLDRPSLPVGPPGPR